MRILKKRNKPGLYLLEEQMNYWTANQTNGLTVIILYLEGGMQDPRYGFLNFELQMSRTIVFRGLTCATWGKHATSCPIL